MTESPLLNVDYFINPTEAFEVVGREVFGDAWRPECRDDPNDNDHQDVLLLLRQALKSGAVNAHWATLDFRADGELRPQDTDREFFRIMLKEDLVFHQGVNEPVRCRIQAEQLRRFLRGQEVQPFTPTQRAKNQCIDWLVEMFADKSRQIPTFERLRRQAKVRFPRLSNHAFKEARKRAIEMTERSDLAKPGRRKNPIRN